MFTGLTRHASRGLPVRHFRSRTRRSALLMLASSTRVDADSALDATAAPIASRALRRPLHRVRWTAVGPAQETLQPTSPVARRQRTVRRDEEHPPTVDLVRPMV